MNQTALSNQKARCGGPCIGRIEAWDPHGVQANVADSRAEQK
jgi:hypothetical protein